MFNLSNLITTSLLTMGVANVTPIYDKQENQNHITQIAENVTSNIVQDYEITLTKTWQNNIYTTNQVINNTNADEYDKGTISDIKYNLNGTNNYLNVVGNEYQTWALKTLTDNPNVDNVSMKMFRNADVYGDSRYDYIHYTRKVIILKFNSYNFNNDVNAHIRINIEIADFDPYLTDEIEIQNLYMARNMYTTTRSNWDNLIGIQPVTDTAKYIINEIKDPDNSYYYSQTTNMTQVNNSIYTDDIALNIVQGGATYVVIEYTPIAEAVFYDTQVQEPYTYAYANIITDDCMFEAQEYKITGTNIIVGQQYEVIDLPGLMWQILTMPFAFVSQAFNLTLFPGTPYQLNIANLFLSIIAIAVFVWLISFFVKR